MNIPWVAGRPEGYHFASQPIVINAAPDVVWNIVKNVGEYHRLSHGAVAASLNQGELKVGNTIHLVLYPEELTGKFVPESDERISVVDEENHVLAWERKLPFGNTSTECYRVLESLDDGKKTRLQIALKIPGGIGFFTNLTLKKRIEQAFNQICAGIKQEAEAGERIHAAP